MSEPQFIRSVMGVPYTDLTEPKRFFTEQIGMSIEHEEAGKLVVVARGNVKLHLFKWDEIAVDTEAFKMTAPVIRIETDDIQAMWREMCERDPEGKHIHPRTKSKGGPELRPWRAWEFGVSDENNVLVLFQQWES